MDINNFPNDFKWGAATASFQIEGAGKEDGRGASIWDTFCDTPGKVVNGDNGLVACDHYHRFEDDIALMKKMGIETYRFSLAWPRLFPNGDSVAEPRGFEFYNRLIDALLEAGIEPAATVYHWDLPQKLQDNGGWANRNTVAAITEYSKAVVAAFGDRVKTWITLNEPWVYSWLGYGSGVHAPGVVDHSQALAAVHHSALAHGAMTRAMRSVRSDLKIGITLNMANVRVSNPESSELSYMGELMDAHVNRFFLDAIKTGQYPSQLVDLYGTELASLIKPNDAEILKVETDFVGVNYYSDNFVNAPTDEDESMETNPVFRFPGRMNGKTPEPRTAMGWPITPWGMRDLLNRVHRDYPNIPEWMITENGAAFDDRVEADGQVLDDDRTRYLEDHIHNVGLAIKDGCPVTAYYYWSFLDNFEWAEGYAKRFGIVHVNFETQERIVKESGFTYSSIIGTHRSSLAVVQ